jgi:hypothetical protein
MRIKPRPRKFAESTLLVCLHVAEDWVSRDGVASVCCQGTPPLATAFTSPSSPRSHLCFDVKVSTRTRMLESATSRAPCVGSPPGGRELVQCKSTSSSRCVLVIKPWRHLEIDQFQGVILRRGGLFYIFTFPNASVVFLGAIEDSEMTF